LFLLQLFNKKEGFSPAEVWSAFVQVAMALHYLHSQGIRHNDLKTDNVLVSGGIYKLIDFGCAKCSSSTATDTSIGGEHACAWELLHIVVPQLYLHAASCPHTFSLQPLHPAAAIVIHNCNSSTCYCHGLCGVQLQFSNAFGKLVWLQLLLLHALPC
jgi:serine/threonine protein kinase